MATKLNRITLKKFFSDGERPTGDNFESAWKSFLNQTDDNISYNDTSNNIELGPNTGLVLGNPTVGVTAGTLRFNSSTGFVQFYDGTDFKDIASGAGAFVPVGAGPSVAFSGGNVGIGTASTVPTHRLEIPLGDNTDAGQQILLGNLLIHKGPSTASGAYIGNTNFGSYALFQDSVGTTKINASNSAGSQLSLAINDVDKFLITQDGDMVLTPSTSVAIRGEVNIGTKLAGHKLTINNTAGTALVVNGVAINTGGWATTSDRRVKKEIRPFNEGLQKLLLFDPVVYKFNGKGGTINNDKDYIGLIAQDVEKVMPELIMSQHIKLDTEDPEESDILGHDLSPLTFIFINSIKELNARLEKLEK